MVFKEGSHNIFSDRLLTGGKELNPLVKKASRDLILSFIQNQGDPTLLEKNQIWQSWSKQYESLLARSSWAPTTQATAQK